MKFPDLNIVRPIKAIPHPLGHTRPTKKEKKTKQKQISIYGTELKFKGMQRTFWDY